MKSDIGWGVTVGCGVGCDGKDTGVGVGCGVAVGAGVAVGTREAVGAGVGEGIAARASETRC